MRVSYFDSFQQREVSLSLPTTEVIITIDEQEEPDRYVPPLCVHVDREGVTVLTNNDNPQTLGVVSYEQGIGDMEVVLLPFSQEDESS